MEFYIVHVFNEGLHQGVTRVMGNSTFRIYIVAMETTHRTAVQAETQRQA